MRPLAPRKANWLDYRPLFWCALAAMTGIALAWHVSIPAAVWLAAGAAVLLLSAMARQRALCLLLCAGTLYGTLAADRMALVPNGQIRDGEPPTVRGILTDLSRGPSDRQPAVLLAQGRLTPDGWRRHTGRYGMHVEASARAGDLVEVSGALHRPLPPTNPGGFDARLYWLRRRAGAVLVPHARGFTRLARTPPRGWEAGAQQARRWIWAVNRATLSPAAAAITNSFLIGETPADAAGTTAEVAAHFRDSGTIHLLVVSGTQVMLVLGVFVGLGWRFFRLRVLFWGLGGLALGGYYLLTSGDAAVSRAAVMGAVFILGLSLKREPDGQNCLGAAALVLLALDPLTLFDAGFQLSCAAAWSLMRLAPAIYEVLQPHRATVTEAGTTHSPLFLAHQSLAGAVAGCLAAHLAVTPILALHFQRASWAGLLANLPMVFVATVLMALAPLHLFLTGLGCSRLAGLVEWTAGALDGGARLFSAPPLGSVEVFPTPAWLLPLCLAGVALPSWLPRSRMRKGLAVAGLAALLLLAERLPAAPPARPTVRALDVGQGDAVLLQAPDGAAILVDGGGSPDPEFDVGEKIVLPALRVLRIAALDAVVLTHPHEDHAGGLAAVVERLPVRLFVESGATSDAPGYRRLQAALRRKRTQRWRAQAGERIQVRSSVLTVLGPLPGAATGSDDLNNGSLVLRWDCAGSRVLLAGDAEREAENALLSWGPELRANVLKMGHHGSESSTQARWLEAVQPRAAVLSCGRDNRFGHPAAGTLKRLQAAGAVVGRTDQDGMVTLRLDGGRVEVERYLAGR